jgi:mono/diheme cytochrome c family protein
MKHKYLLKIIYITIFTVFTSLLFIIQAKPEVKEPVQINQPDSTWKAPNSANALKNPLSGNMKAARDGKKLFKLYCVTCHGNKGEGNGISAAALNPKPANLTLKRIQKQSDGAIFWKITTGNPPMVSWKYTLTKKQRWELVDFIRQLAKK